MVRNMRNILDPGGTTVPEANYSPICSETNHDRVLVSYHSQTTVMWEAFLAYG